MNMNITREVCQKGAKASGDLQRKRAEETFYAQDRHCFNCGKKLELKPTDKVHVKKKFLHCSISCGRITYWRKKRLELGLPEPKIFEPERSTLPFKTKGEVRKSQINHHARQVYYSRFEKLVCEICNYEYKIQVCHVKAIKNFSKDEKLIVINNIDNLVGLCANHHTEQEDKLLPEETIKALIAARPSRPQYTYPKIGKKSKYA